MTFKMLYMDPAFSVVFDSKVVGPPYLPVLDIKKLKVSSVYFKNLCYLYVLPIQKYENHLKIEMAGKWAFFVSGWSTNH